MQPRSDLEEEEEEETVFQVTKRGDSVSVEERWEVRRGWRPGWGALVMFWILRVSWRVGLGLGNRRVRDLGEGGLPMGTKEAEDEEGVVLLVDGESEVEEDDAGVELPLEDPESRSKSGLRGTGSDDDDGLLDSLSEGGEESADEASCCSSSSSSSRPLGYAAHEDCTWYSVMGVRFSRLAASDSKQ